MALPKIATPLSAAKVRTAGPGRHADGDGLYLFVRSPDRAFWVFRYRRAGRLREMGLGRARGPNSVGLAEARQKAGALHQLTRSGVDPLEQREAEAAAAKAQKAAEAARAITFRAVATSYIESHQEAWKNAKHRAQWTSTLATYAYPVLGDLPVADVGTADVLRVLEEVWTKKPETASRIRGRIESILDYAKTREWRAGENPARWKGHLDKLLPARSKVRKVEHHAALPWCEIGEFMSELRKQDGVGVLALRFAILTAARTGEVIGARWSEIDLQAAAWTVPAERMKAGKMHRVPLSEAALALLRDVSQLAGDAPDPHVFPGMRPGAPLSNMALLMALRRMGRGDLTAHGFRSTFRDWAAETGKAADLAEAALAHKTGDKTVQAYLRGDLFERRRKLMDQWAEWCSRPSAERGNVVELLKEALV